MFLRSSGRCILRLRRSLAFTAVFATLGVASAAAGGTVAGASAASLGGLTSSNLFASTLVAAANAPTVAAWENFNGTNGVNIAGTTTDGGAKVWSAPRCTWTVQSNRARSMSGDCPLIINSGLVNSSSEVTIVRSGTTWDTGIIMNSNTAATQFLTLEYTSASNGSLELWRFNGGWTQLGGVTNLHPGGVGTAPASVVLRLASPGPVSPATTSVLTASLNGTPRFNVTLSAANQTTFKNATHMSVGVYTFNDPVSTLDDFHVDTP